MSLPEPGQRVDLRGGAYMVQETDHTPAERRTDGSLQPAATHVRLTSLQEDVFGESLEVIWELEPGARVHEDHALPQPTGFDDPRRLDAFLDALRWGAVVQADHTGIQAPFRGGVTPEPYQLDPVVRAVTMPRANLLIADDVGLGKTIEAGLVVQELMLRGRARSVLVVCPSALQVQWQEQMRDKFGLDFHIVDRAFLGELRRRRGPRANPWSSYPRLITSIDYLKRPNPLRLMEDVLGKHDTHLLRPFDVLVVDEAHCVAPSAAGRYPVDSARTRTIRRLGRAFEHKLFLTATPHNGDPNSWTALLELLDDQRFTRGVAPDPDQLQRVMVRRMKSHITDDLNLKRFHDRIIEEIPVPYTDTEKELYACFRDYAARRRARAADTQQEYALEFSLKLLKKRLFSSPGAFLCSIDRHAARLTEPAPAAPQAGRTASGLRLLRAYLAAPDEAEPDEDPDQSEEDGLARLSFADGYQPPLDEAERALLQALCAGAKRAASRADSKATLLIDRLNALLRPDGHWNRERVIVFTEYRDSLTWLMERFQAAGLLKRTRTILGGMHRDEREAVKAAFQADPDSSEVRILLATDAAGEGLDLQNHCRYLIHYEIPWNPNRMEQRNGRIDRHGQRRAPHIFHFVGAGFDPDRAPADLRPGDLEGDLEFLAIAARKVNRIREDLGAVGPVIAAHIAEAMSGRRSSLRTESAEAAARAVRAGLRFEREQQSRIRDLQDQYHQARRRLGLSPEALENAVRTGLALADKPPLEAVTLPRGGHRVYRLPELSGGWAAAAEGLAHPFSRAVRPITFDPEVAAGHDDVVLVHLGHKLVQLCLRLLRAEVWAAGEGRRLHRVCARIVPDAAFEERPRIYLVVHARLLMIGATHQRLHEELVLAGGSIVGNDFHVADDAMLARLLPQAGADPLPDHRCSALAALFPRHSARLQRALDVRIGRHAKRLRKLLDAHRAQEEALTHGIFDTLARALDTRLAELGSPEQHAQLELFEPEERDALHADRDILTRRRAGLDGERTRELAAVAARYAEPVPKYFPVSLTWLVPASQATH